MTAATREVIWRPQAGPQTALIKINDFNNPPIFEVFYGGARGGGKTDGMLGDWILHAGKYGASARGVFFRRRAKALEQAIERSHQLFKPLGAKFVGGNQLEWRFPDAQGRAEEGAVLTFRHLWDKAAADEYLGHSYTRVYFEELPQWPSPEPINMIRATIRSAEGVHVGMRATGNPGGPGHNWVKARYIDPSPKGYEKIRDPKTGHFFVFIPARLEDNKVLMESDPGYESRMMASGPDALMQAWRYGNWDIVAGGYFDRVWNPDRQVLQPFAIPKGWRFRRGFDWGSSKPSSLGFWAISDGNRLPEDHQLYPGKLFPKGSLIRIDEWYTVAYEKGQVRPNVGLQLTNEQLGQGIWERSMNHNWQGCVADPSIWTQSGGKSIYQQMQLGAARMGGRLTFLKADTTRVAGWKLMTSMLEESAKAVPEDRGLWVFESCQHFIRTVPSLQMDDKHPDDVDTEAEDHIADETRYVAMSAARGGGSIERLVI
jgi:hypothetical protein